MFATAALAALLAHSQEDFATIDSTVQALYTVISGNAGDKRDWNKFKSLFAPGGMLRASVRAQSGTIRLVEMSPDRYVELTAPAMEKAAFWEREIHRTTEQFGEITNVFSTYASSATKDGEPFQRGINAIQLRFDGTRWWIISVLWQGETKDNPLPKQFLPGR
jgi:hypothetical protein